MEILRFLHLVEKLLQSLIRGTMGLILLALGVALAAAAVQELFQGESLWYRRKRPSNGPTNPYANAPVSPRVSNRPKSSTRV